MSSQTDGTRRATRPAGSARVVLGVTGGIAAYKAPIIARLLIKAGHGVRVIPTPNALQMVGQPTFAALTGQPVTTGIFDDPAGVEHVQLGSEADIVVIAPATAHTIAKLAAGMADNLLTATALVATCPVVVAPAMHTQMWNHPATQANIATLRERGVVIIEPAEGPLTGADSGVGRLPEPEDIVARVREVLGSGEVATQGERLTGKRILVTAGGTREPLDPVRFLGNRSSGRQGVALAESAARQGAEVTLVAANVSPDVVGDSLAVVVDVETTAELQEAVLARACEADVIIMAAAIADYRPASVAEAKMKKSADEPLSLTLEQNPDILAGLAADRFHGALVVGFAAETGDDNGTVLDHGRAKALRKGADLLAVNDVSAGRGFGDVPNSITVLDNAGNVVTTGEGTKSHIADVLIGAIADRLATLD